jgi:hypothetical protein
MELMRVPYPSKYAFLNGNVIPMPFIHILNRLFVVQVETEEGLKTIAGNHPNCTEFPNMPNSSELTGYWGFPSY